MPIKYPNALVNKMHQPKFYIPALTLVGVLNVGLLQAMLPLLMENKPLVEGIIDHETRSPVTLELAGGETLAYSIVPVAF